MTSGISLPVREELQVAFSWAVVEQLEKGRWAVAEKRAQDKFVPPSLCATATGGKMSESSGLTLKDMSGVFIVTVLAMLLSFMVYFLERCINITSTKWYRHAMDRSQWTDWEEDFCRSIEKP